MARRPYDKTPGFRRGAEPVSHPIWGKRTKRLLRELEGRPMNARELARHMARTKRWTGTYTKNVLAAADLGGIVVHVGGKWTIAANDNGVPPEKSGDSGT